MTLSITLTDDTYSANGSDGRKRIYATGSLTNPYSTGGETITTSTYFGNVFDGGVVTMINPSVSILNAGIAQTGKFRGTNASTTSAVLQFFNVSLGGSTAGTFVDNTVANLSSTTVYLEMIGR
jgi:hypothetical protein